MTGHKRITKKLTQLNILWCAMLRHVCLIIGVYIWAPFVMQLNSQSFIPHLDSTHVSPLTMRRHQGSCCMTQQAVDTGTKHREASYRSSVWTLLSHQAGSQRSGCKPALLSATLIESPKGQQAGSWVFHFRYFTDVCGMHMTAAASFLKITILLQAKAGCGLLQRLQQRHGKALKLSITRKQLENNMK